jgi:hypothetical protein
MIDKKLGRNWPMFIFAGILQPALIPSNLLLQPGMQHNLGFYSTL